MMPRGFCCALFFALTLVLSAPGHGTEPDELIVTVNKSRLLRLEHPFAHVAVGNPAIADIMPMTDHSIYVLGKTPGTTTLSLFDHNKQLQTVLELSITPDVDGLKRKLHELMPLDPIEVRTIGDSVVLSGTTISSDHAGRALALAENYAPKKVTNLLRVVGSQQVMLAVKVAEVNRTVTRALGVKPNITVGDFSFSTLDPVDASRFGLAQLTGAFAMQIDALEQKGLVKVLAEPNLIALSGDTANFLAGGEFPVPIAQGTSGGIAITVEFKKFGVGLAFTPTVLEGGLINLRVSPEVSEIDRTNSVIVSGFSIPGLSTRRATTTVELHDGQSFAIAGLLQSDFQDQIRQLPGLGNVPILGALARSSDFQRSETELVIIVTPHLVHPVAEGGLASPIDSFAPPSDLDIFLNGRVEGQFPKTQETAGAGLAGHYGYMLK